MSKIELSDKDLEAIGIDPKNINTAAIPDNLAPKVREELFKRAAEQAAKGAVAIPEGGTAWHDLPTPEMRHNERVRMEEGMAEEDRKAKDQTSAASKKK